MEIEIDKNIFAETGIKQNDCNEIVKISKKELSYNKFFHEFMLKNIPVVIKNENLLTTVASLWFHEIDHKISQLQIEKLEDILGAECVPVYNCSKQYFNSHEKMSMPFNEFVDYWKSTDRQKLLYLKDFHLKQQFPELDFYNTPKYFASDWLNEYLVDEKMDDYRFVYIGTSGTFTPFHADVFGSYSWSGNVCGRKRWILLPPGEEFKLKDQLNNLPFSIDESMLKEHDVKYFDIIQEANETLFVPSGWYHQVINLTDVFSINHNWFNSCNVLTILENLVKNYANVKQEISDCSDMENFEDHCQLMLKSIFGMNFEDFIKILLHISHKRIERLQKFKIDSTTFENFSIGQNHAKYDVQKIVETAEKLSEFPTLREELGKILHGIIKCAKDFI